MYRVLVHFTDLQDENRPYHPGDTFPRDGLSVTDERLSELSGPDNRRGVQLIEFVADEDAENNEAEDSAEDAQEDTPKRRKR